MCTKVPQEKQRSLSVYISIGGVCGSKFGSGQMRFRGKGAGPVWHKMFTLNRAVLFMLVSAVRVSPCVCRAVVLFLLEILFTWPSWACCYVCCVHSARVIIVLSFLPAVTPHEPQSRPDSRVCAPASVCECVWERQSASDNSKAKKLLKWPQLHFQCNGVF